MCVMCVCVCSVFACAYVSVSCGCSGAWEVRISLDLSSLTGVSLDVLLCVHSVSTAVVRDTEEEGKGRAVFEKLFEDAHKVWSLAPHTSSVPA